MIVNHSYALQFKYDCKGYLYIGEGTGTLFNVQVCRGGTKIWQPRGDFAEPVQVPSGNPYTPSCTQLTYDASRTPGKPLPPPGPPMQPRQANETAPAESLTQILIGLRRRVCWRRQ